MKIKKIIGITLLIIAMLLLSLGIIFLVIVPQFKQVEEISKKKNESEQLSKKHCLEGLCIDDLVITKENEICYFNGNLKNTTEADVSDKYINIIFTDSKKKEKKIWYHIDLMLPGDIIMLNIGMPDQDSFDSSDYRIEKPSDEEIKEYEKIVKEQQSASGY